MAEEGGLPSWYTILGAIFTKDPMFPIKAQAQYEQLRGVLEQKKLAETPISEIVKTGEMQQINKPQGDEFTGPSEEPKTKFMEFDKPKLNMEKATVGNFPIFQKIQESLTKEGPKTSFHPPGTMAVTEKEGKITGTKQIGEKEKTPGSDIGKLWADRKVLVDQGFSEDHPAIKAIDAEMIKKSSTEMTDYQRENIEVRKQQVEDRKAQLEENRALRKQMHDENIGIRKQLLELSKQKVNRIPPSAQKDINNKTTKLDQYISLMESFKDQYGGSVMFGPTMTEVHSRLGTDKERVGWWKEWKLLDSAVRHELFGATLTGYEKKSWDAVSISENTDSDIARAAMQKRLEIATNALEREIEGYSGAGWDVERPSGKVRPAEGKKERTIIKTGRDKKTGKRVIQYSDGSLEYAK